MNSLKNEKKIIKNTIINKETFVNLKEDSKILDAKLQKLQAGPYKKKKIDDIESDPLFGKGSFFDGVKETVNLEEKDDGDSKNFEKVKNFLKKTNKKNIEKKQ